MPGTYVNEGENLDMAMKRFKRLCEKSGLLPAKRKKEFYEKPCELRKQRLAAAKKRSLKRRIKEMSKSEQLRRARRRKVF